MQLRFTLRWHPIVALGLPSLQTLARSSTHTDGFSRFLRDGYGSSLHNLLPYRSGIHLTPFFQRVQYGAQVAVELVGHFHERCERFAQWVFDILGFGKHWSNDRGCSDDRFQAFLNGEPLDQALLSAILAHVGEIIHQERVTDGVRCQCDDVFALILFEAEYQIRFLRHGFGKAT